MAKDNMTPEEKLLKIIEDPDIEKRKLHPRAASMRMPGPDFLDVWLKGFKLDRAIIARYVDLRVINIAVFALSGLFTIFFIFDFLSSGAGFKKHLEGIKNSPIAQEEVKAAGPSGPDIDIDRILALSKGRNIFTLLPPKPVVQKITDIQTLSANLKLVGIIWSDNPQAMIEDTKEQKTYLLNAGQNIGEINIKAILTNKIIIGKDDQQWELR